MKRRLEIHRQSESIKNDTHECVDLLDHDIVYSRPFLDLVHIAISRIRKISYVFRLNIRCGFIDPNAH